MSNLQDIQTVIAEATWINDMKNRVVVLRHGFARTLEAGLVVSGLPAGEQPEYGLTDEGGTLARKSAEEALREGLLSGDELVVSSPFSRTRDTARILCDVLGIDGFDEDHRLRERYFGEYDMGPHDVYPSVWVLDREDPAQTVRGVESLIAVTERLFDFFCEWRGKTDGKMVVVTHGDPALVIRSLFVREDPRHFRDNRDLAPAGFLDLSTE